MKLRNLYYTFEGFIKAEEKGEKQIILCWGKGKNMNF